MSLTLHFHTMASITMRLSIPTKLFIAFSAVILTFAIVLMIGIWRSQKLNTQNHAIHQSIIPLSLNLSDAQNDIKSIHVILTESNPERLSHMLDRMALISIAPKHASSKLVRAKSLGQHHSFKLLSAQEQARITDILARIDKLIITANNLDNQTHQLSQKLASSSINTTQINALRAQMLEDTQTLDTGLSHLRNDLRITTDVILLRLQQHERGNLYALGAMSIVALIIALLLLIIALKIVQPLKPLTSGVKRIADGDYTPIQEPKHSILGKDELLTLTQEFNFMAQALVARDEAIKQQHAALLRSERLATIGRMTSLITHEIRNPLSSIGLNTEMLQDFFLDIHSNDKDEILSILSTITNEVDRLSDITEEYLVYARHPDPKPSREDLISILEQLIDFHSWEWSTHAIDVSLTLTPSNLTQAIAHVDPNQLRQALLNLLKNAVEASPPESTIEVELVDADESWAIHIRDEGKGLAPEHMDRLFEPFFTNKEQGTGLGLPMTLQIIEQHHGLLSAKNNPNKGACFTIELPKHGQPKP